MASAGRHARARGGDSEDWAGLVAVELWSREQEYLQAAGDLEVSARESEYTKDPKLAR